MSTDMISIPHGTGQHPIRMVVLSANQLDASSAFYRQVFEWSIHRFTPELAVAMLAGGPAVSLRAGVPEGSPGAVPFLAVSDVRASLDRVVAAGGSIEREPWKIPMVGTLARFQDTSGTLYGLTDAKAPGPVDHVPMPFGANPKPAAGTICSMEMYAKDGSAAGGFFGEQFGWGSAATMPQFVGFDPGAGVGGVFQSHTPALPAVAYVYVADVKTTMAAIVAAGGKSHGDPMAMPGMATFGYFADPSGTMMGLIGS